MADKTSVYVCARCEWVTDGLNTYLAHKCDPGVAALRSYQRAAAVWPLAPGQSRWTAERAWQSARTLEVAAAFRSEVLR